MPVIRLQQDVYERLLRLKKTLGHRSFSETVNYLLDRATNPRTFLESLAYFAEDMRRDVKELKETLKQLVEAIK